jgi:hypothetical protein
MAHTFYCINHPKNSGEKFFFIQNTFFELQETVPMDLTTFLCFLLENDNEVSRTKDGKLYSPWIKAFTESWEQLKSRGTTANIDDIDELMNSLDLKRLYEDAKYAGSGWRSIKNEDSSRYLYEILDKGQVDQDDLIGYLGGEIVDWFGEIPSKYYKSSHYLMSFLFDKTGGFPEIHDDSVAISFIYKNNPFELEMVPHKFRCLGFFKDECERTNQHNLIPVPDETPANYSVYTGEIAEVIDILSKYPELVVFLEKSMKNENAIVDLIRGYKANEGFDTQDNNQEDDLPF